MASKLTTIVLLTHCLLALASPILRRAGAPNPLPIAANCSIIDSAKCMLSGTGCPPSKKFLPLPATAQTSQLYAYYLPLDDVLSGSKSPDQLFQQCLETCNGFGKPGDCRSVFTSWNVPQAVQGVAAPVMTYACQLFNKTLGPNDFDFVNDTSSYVDSRVGKLACPDWVDDMVSSVASLLPVAPVMSAVAPVMSAAAPVVSAVAPAMSAIAPVVSAVNPVMSAALPAASSMLSEVEGVLPLPKILPRRGLLPLLSGGDLLSGLLPIAAYSSKVTSAPAAVLPSTGVAQLTASAKAPMALPTEALAALPLSLPTMPGLPAMPSILPAMPNVGAVSSGLLPGLPNMPSLPGMSDLLPASGSKLPTVPGLPTLPEMSSLLPGSSSGPSAAANPLSAVTGLVPAVSGLLPASGAKSPAVPYALSPASASISGITGLLPNMSDILPGTSSGGLLPAMPDVLPAASDSFSSVTKLLPGVSNLMPSASKSAPVSGMSSLLPDASSMFAGTVLGTPANAWPGTPSSAPPSSCLLSSLPLPKMPDL